jgi:hypothetical protein
MNEINRWPSGNIAYNGGLDTTLGQWDFSTSFEFGGVIESLPEPSLTEGGVPAGYKHHQAMPFRAFRHLLRPLADKSIEFVNVKIAYVCENPHLRYDLPLNQRHIQSEIPSPDHF